jgi:hypothetical protein
MGPIASGGSPNFRSTSTRRPRTRKWTQGRWLMEAAQVFSAQAHEGPGMVGGPRAGGWWGQRTSSAHTRTRAAGSEAAPRSRAAATMGR